MAPDEQVAVLDHPLVAERLRLLRDERTPSATFRTLAAEVSRFVAYEAFRDLRTREVRIDTPVVTDVAARTLDEDFVIVPILRAGLGMATALEEVLPTSRVYLVGIRRDEATFEPQLYLDGLPPRLDGLHAVVCDPMLATGGSTTLVVGMLDERGAARVTVLCLLAATAGVERLIRAHPGTRVVTAALDPTLNDAAYIVPGLGDAGDRLFGPG